MELGALIDILYAGILLGELDPIWVGSGVLAVAITAALLVAAYSPRLTHVAVLHLALAYEVVACLFMATIVPWFTI